MQADCRKVTVQSLISHWPLYMFYIWLDRVLCTLFTSMLTASCAKPPQARPPLPPLFNFISNCALTWLVQVALSLRNHVRVSS